MYAADARQWSFGGVGWHSRAISRPGGPGIDLEDASNKAGAPSLAHPDGWPMLLTSPATTTKWSPRSFAFFGTTNACGDGSTPPDSETKCFPGRVGPGFDPAVASNKVGAPSFAQSAKSLP